MMEHSTVTLNIFPALVRHKKGHATLHGLIYTLETQAYFDNPTITGYGVHSFHTRCKSCTPYSCIRGPGDSIVHALKCVLAHYMYYIDLELT